MSTSPTDERIEELAAIAKWCENALHEIACLREERDEARRMYCMAQSHVDEEYGKTILPEEQAQQYGWDCFKETR